VSGYSITGACANLRQGSTQIVLDALCKKQFSHTNKYAIECKLELESLDELKSFYQEETAIFLGR
jgi:hypothetical protein